MPVGIWDRLGPRAGSAGDDATVATARVGGRPDDGNDRDEEVLADSPASWEEQTGGLEVIGANVDEESPRRRGLRRPRRARTADVPPTAAIPAQPVLAEPPVAEAAGPLTDDEIPVVPYDSRHDRRRRRRRRRPFAILFALLVLGGIVGGIVLGGQKLLDLLDPSSRDYTGSGSGSIDIRVNQGDTLSDIARTLDGADVIASTGPFVSAAKSHPDATGIQPGVYTLRLKMSGESALELLLDPAARQVSRVTLREGLTVVQTLALIAEDTGTPLEELQAAAADPVALGLPAYANGMLEGFLFPATYDFEPDDTAVDMLSAMVVRAEQAFDALQVPEADRLTVLTKASIVQAEAAGTEDMAKVARVLENRLADGMPLQLDTTVNYANGKGGITTTAADRANPSPYNTYVHPGLPPGAISNPGEEALKAVLAPAEGDWRFFVVVNPDTGETRFARTGAEHQQNVLLFQQWLRENPEG
ncbi:endolytic transglycosylase MltG [Blastococcus sp. TF02-8]|nr:endolytic transglycosylase MltG [Blastococcus sp. TF02-8]